MRWKESTYREIDEEAFVDEDLIERVDFIDQDMILHDDSWKVDSNNEEEMRHISELYRVAMNMDKRELLTICSLTVRKYPLAFMQVLAEFVLENLNIRKGK